jgi:hypothetical protein
MGLEKILTFKTNKRSKESGHISTDTFQDVKLKNKKNFVFRR